MKFFSFSLCWISLKTLHSCDPIETIIFIFILSIISNVKTQRRLTVRYRKVPLQVTHTHTYIHPKKMLQHKHMQVTWLWRSCLLSVKYSQGFCFGKSGEILTLKLRLKAFTSMMRQVSAMKWNEKPTLGSIWEVVLDWLWLETLKRGDKLLRVFWIEKCVCVCQRWLY